MISLAMLSFPIIPFLFHIQSALVLGQPQCQHDLDQSRRRALELLPFDPQQKIIEAMVDSCKASSTTYFDSDEDLPVFSHSRRSVLANREPAALACEISKDLFTDPLQYVDESVNSAEYSNDIKDYWLASSELLFQERLYKVIYKHHEFNIDFLNISNSWSLKHD